MTFAVIYRGYKIWLSDEVPGDRRGSYEIIDGVNPSYPVVAECGGFQDLELIAKRVVDRMIIENGQT